MKNHFFHHKKGGFFHVHFIFISCIELCHLVHRRHDAAFYKLLEKHMPDWEKRKHRLELALR
ncbi:MAG: M48 family metallopeptidase [Thermodesulfobacteriota bacterium]|nr:M48 family metallopeptidase [Thermodesulfobacteriota bacterium]